MISPPRPRRLVGLTPPFKWNYLCHGLPGRSSAQVRRNRPGIVVFLGRDALSFAVLTGSTGVTRKRAPAYFETVTACRFSLWIVGGKGGEELVLSGESDVSCGTVRCYSVYRGWVEGHHRSRRSSR